MDFVIFFPRRAKTFKENSLRNLQPPITQLVLKVLCTSLSIVPTCTPLTCTTTSAPSGHDDDDDEWMMKKKSFFLFAEIWHSGRPRWIKFQNFRMFQGFFEKLEKLQILWWKVGNFCSKSHYSVAHSCEKILFADALSTCRHE